ncbi:glycoside hydrolase family 2, partial [Streptomyces sp. SID11233]|nr:glycoside hydrolase family 2 [Streptomyces sp. SID11233]
MHSHLDVAGHPRPQLVREPDWRDLCGTWQFAHDDADQGRRARWMAPETTAPWTRAITVPYPPESPASGIHDTDQHPVLWYRRTLDLRAPAPGRRLLL